MTSLQPRELTPEEEAELTTPEARRLYLGYLKNKPYFDKILAGWPEPTEKQIRTMHHLLGPTGGSGPAPYTGPSEYELQQRQQAREREDALKKAQKAALALTACDVCNLQPEVHHIRRAQRIDMHEWVPGRAEKVMARG
jgi:hypothetical protein